MTEIRNYDAEFCGNVPLHNINLIQDYGYLLVVGYDGLKIIQASENTAGLLGLTIDDVVSRGLADFWDAESLDQLQSIQEKGLTNRVPLNICLQSGLRLQALLHFKENYLLVELEESSADDERRFAAVFQDLKLSIAAIEQGDTLQKVCENAIQELRKIAGFDGVLMYRFDEDWNGTVIAEEKDPRLEPYIGQKFPASDIPKQARLLYLKNPYRLIANRDYTPVRLFPVINPLTNAFLDLSDCNLRSVPAVHLEYMKNMGIKASMSVRVLRNEQLWGLISCHNIEPITVDFEKCAIFELLSSVISNKVSAILNKEEFDFRSKLQSGELLLKEDILATDNIETGILKGEGKELLNLFNASGLAVSINGQLSTAGKVPSKDSIENLLFWLESKTENSVFAHSALSKIYDEAADYADVGSGILAIPINSSRGDFLICFREEVVRTVNWGGDPNQALTFEKDGKNYHPRNSFNNWQQRVKNNSLPWLPAELEIAGNLRSFLFELRARQLQ